jgi:translation initiation factor 1
LHFQQRTARKCLTLVQGMPDDLDLKKIIRHFKKNWCCNGTTVEHDEWGTIIQLQGDHRRDILKFLIEEGISYKENIKVHGHY